MTGATAGERSPLEKLARSRALQLQHHVEQLLIWFGSAQRQYPVTVLGIHPTERSLILSAPVGPDGSLLAVMRDQTMSGRWSSPVAVFTFRAVVTELAVRPHPVLHAGQISAVVRFNRRQLPRVATALPATLHADGATEPAMLTDLSVSGAKLALAGGRLLQSGQQMQLALRLRMLERDRVLRLECTVVSDQGETDPEHPQVHYYGACFTGLDDITALLLQSHVQQLMLQQADPLGRLLQADVSEAAPGG